MPVQICQLLALSQGYDSRYPNATIVYVGNYRDPGDVYAIVDREGSGKVEVQTFIKNFKRPSGVVWRNNSLWIAEPGQITRFDGVDEYALNGTVFAGPRTVISTAFPWNQTIHQDHHLAFGPDGWLYLPQGAESNTGPCAPVSSVLTHCTLNRMRPDGSDLQAYGTGIRNTVGWDWHPDNGDLWVGMNERQELFPDQDDHPDDTLLYLPRQSLYFGFPFCHWVGEGSEYDRDVGPPNTTIADDVNVPPGARNVNDTAGFRRYCTNTSVVTPPVQALGPHAAPLGMKFYTGEMFPSKYNRTIFMTQHGSGNRKVALGYRIVTIAVDPDGEVLSYDTFAQGWLRDPIRRAFWGRPNDVLQLRDGSLLVSDDYAAAVYRITYEA
ncbi:hypothetical protein WJX73_005685 [Symbiochloris irregularis]|uniref:Pyrroloquinoline quinone-dependent pyranose dehydrogenase beta-propeller domain-containing protein n=1 Tax=Symbiochloris irregularis TaxID=706552 RepID=A0AAW1NWJ7_9CHLO